MVYFEATEFWVEVVSNNGKYGATIGTKTARSAPFHFDQKVQKMSNFKLENTNFL